MKAIGFVDRLNGGFRTYVIRSGTKDVDGNNIVLHESWHQTAQAARKSYRQAILGLKMVSEYTNCQRH